MWWKMSLSEWILLSVSFLIIGAGCLPNATYKAIGNYVERKFTKNSTEEEDLRSE